jgi:hypothetical protein
MEARSGDGDLAEYLTNQPVMKHIIEKVTTARNGLVHHLAGITPIS